MNRLLAAVFAMPLMVIAASFEQNRGQTDSRVRYLVHEPAGTVFFTADSVAVRPRGADTNIEWTLPGSKPDAAFHLEDQTSRRRNYKVGRDPSHWVENLPSYSRLRRSETYEGIDIVYRTVTDQRSGLPLEYDFIVQPGADPSIIRIRFAEGSRVEIAADGSLEIESGGSRITHRAPVAYQETESGRQGVQARFRRVAEREFAFDTGPYDRSRTLVIDPELLTFTRFGGSGDDVLVGNRWRYPLHSTDSLEFTPSSQLGARTRNLYISYYALNTGTIETIIGGSGDEVPLAIDYRCDNLVVVGRTTSRDLPTGQAVAQRDYGGGESDGFVLAIASQGGTAISYWGGSGRDQVTSVTGCMFAGETDSPDLPGLSISGQRIHGGSDIVVSRLTTFWQPAFGEPLVIGGEGDDSVNAMTTLGSGKLALVGETRSRDFPRDNDQDPILGTSDAFWMVLATGFGPPEIEFSRTFGGTGRDRLLLLEPEGGTADSLEGPLVMAGVTDSPGLPSALEMRGSRGGAGDLFALWVAAPGWNPIRSFVWGGAGDEVPAGLWSAKGRTIFTGTTTSRDLPLRNPAQARYGGGASDGFALILEQPASVAWASYFGGEGRDVLLAPRDGFAGSSPSPGVLEVTGWSDSTDWSELNGANGLISRPLGGIDSFTATFSTELGPVISPVVAAAGVLAPVDVALPRGPDPGSRIRVSIVEPELGALTTDPSGAAAAAFVEVAGATQGAEAWLIARRPGTEITLRAEAPGFPPSLRKVRVGRLRVKARGPVQRFVSSFRETIELEIVREDGTVPFDPATLPRRAALPSIVAEILTPGVVRFAKGGTRQVLSAGEAIDFEGTRPGPWKARFRVEGSAGSEADLEGEIVEAAPSVADSYGPQEMTVMPGASSLRVQCSPDPLLGVPQRVESLDPSVLRFGSRLDALSAVVTPRGSSVTAYGLRPGTSTLVIDCHGADGTTLRFERAIRVRALSLVPSASVMQIGVGERVSTMPWISFTIQRPETAAKSPVVPLHSLPAGVEIDLRFRSLDPGIVSAGPSQITLSGPNSRMAPLLTGLRPGLTMVEAIASGSALGDDPVIVRTEVRVVPARVPKTIDTGKGFISTGGVYLRASRLPVTLTVADPSVAAIVTLAGPVASARFETFNDWVGTPLLGLVDRGETSLRVEPAGMEPFDVPVRIRPVSLVLSNAARFSGSEAGVGSQIAFYVNSAVIDPDTMLPVSPVGLHLPDGTRPPPLSFKLAGASVAPVNSPRLDWPRVATFEAVQPGETVITVEQIEGTVASALSSVRVPVVPPKPVERWRTVAAGGQAILAFDDWRLKSGRYSVRSSDPSRIVLSTSPELAGTREIGFDLTSSGFGLFAQAAGAIGSTTVDLLRDGSLIERYVFSIRQRAWEWYQRSLTVQAGRVTPVPVVLVPDQRPAREPAPYPTFEPLMLGPGGSARLEIRSVNPEVARTATPDVTVTAGSGAARIDIEAVSPGETELIVTDTATRLTDRIRVTVTP